MKKLDILFFALVIIAIIGVAYLVKLLSNETSMCIRNPFIYGASKIKDVSCSCTKYTNVICPPSFFFNDTSFVAEKRTCGTNIAGYEDFNLSGLTLTSQ